MNIIIVLIIFSLLNKKNSSINFNNNLVDSLDLEKTNDKIEIMRKVAPYFPEEYIPTINKALLLTTKIITLYEATNFIQTGKPFKSVKYKEVENNKERLNYIITTLKKEVPNENVKSLITTLEMIINIDKYKDMIIVFNNIMSDSEKTKDIDQLISLIEPFVDNINDDQKEQLYNIARILQK